MAQGQLAGDAPAIGAEEEVPLRPQGSRAVELLARWWILIFLVGLMNYWFGVGLALWATAAWVALR